MVRLTKRKPSPTLVYVISIALALVVGTVSGLVSMGGMKAFAGLKQPPLSPPGWLFPIAWTILYVLMGISAAKIYLSGGDGVRSALVIYVAQLIVNFLWSPLFFELELRLVAFIWLLLLIALVVKMIIDFHRIDKTAAYLQIPYLIWLVFAGYLNLGVFILNN